MRGFASALLLCGLGLGQALARPPQPLRFAPLQFAPPKVERRVLSTGTTVFLLRDGELPLINLETYVRTGTMYDPADQTGLGTLCATLLRSGGTATREPDALDEELEFLGASLESTIDTEVAEVSLSVLKKDLDEGLALWADMLEHPAFRKGKLEIEKAKAVETIRRRNDEPYQIARREFRKFLYGPAHPLSRQPEVRGVSAISRGDLEQFYGRYYRPNNLMIAVAGDFDPDEMVQKLEAALRGWPSAPVVFPRVPEAPEPGSSGSGRVIGYVDKDVNQSSVILGDLGVKRHDPDHFALEVMNAILGGSSFSSRLMSEVRERLGLAYWVGSTFTEYWDYGVVAAGLQTKSGTTGQAIGEVLAQVDRIRKAPVSGQELKLAKDSLINSFVFRYASSSAVAEERMHLEYFGYPEDYLDTYTDKIAAVTAADVQRVAQKYLHPERFRIVVVGKSKDFDKPLSEFGAVRSLDVRIPE